MEAGPPARGLPVRASVKWYDAGSGHGYGFLAPEDGAADIFCHASVLQEVGLARLVAGAAVSCEVAPGRHGDDRTCRTILLPAGNDPSYLSA